MDLRVGQKAGPVNAKGRPVGAALQATELERARRFERPTLTLARLCSTPELRPHSVSVRILYKSPRAAARGKSIGFAKIMNSLLARNRGGRARVGTSVGHPGWPICKETAMKGILAWAIGLPIPIIILLYLFDVF